jgi:glycosyltransferase involved in cell wall biosynthesis
MKVLMLTPYLPYPLLSGGQTRTYNLLKKLATSHEITLFAFIRKESEKDFLPELTKLGINVKVFRRRKAWEIKNILLAGFSLFPFLVSIYLSRGLKNRLKQELESGDYDVVHAEPFYVVPNLPKLTVPLLLVDQTIEYIVYQHFVEKFKYWIIRPLLWIDVMKIKYWETRYWRQASRVVAMSDDDLKIMQKEVPGLTVDVVPNGVDSNYFDRTKHLPEVSIAKSDGPVVLFVGSSTWLQNREAIDILYKEVWPIILKKIPNAKLWIIGKSVEHFFGKIATNNVRVAEVEDIREAYFAATVMVAPMYGSGGTRYKNLESFAAGLPVVSTSIGFNGLDVVDGVHVLVREKPQDLANAAIEVIENKILREKLVKNAKLLVKDKYDWEPIATRLSQIYEEIAKS